MSIRPLPSVVAAAAALFLCAVDLPAQKKGGGGGGGGGGGPPPDPAIAFVESGRIKVMNDDGSNVRTVVATGQGESANFPCWSPDGQQLAFCGVLGGQQGMWKVNLDGSGLQLVAPQSGFPEFVDWSRVPCPDGRHKIAFLSDTANGMNDLFVVNTDGTGLQNLTNSPEDERTATWTRDASGLYVGWSMWEVPTPTEGGDLVQLDALVVGGLLVTAVTPIVGNGGGFVCGCSVANHSDKVFVMDYVFDIWTVADATVLPWQPVPFGFGYDVPSFSPDDSRIVLDGNGGIYVANSDGSGAVRIRRSGRWPVWRP